MIIGDAAHAMVPFYGQGTNCVSLTLELSLTKAVQVMSTVKAVVKLRPEKSSVAYFLEFSIYLEF